MNSLDLDDVKQYVNANIDTFHESRIRLVSGTTLAKIVNKNPYLSRAKNVIFASELVAGGIISKTFFIRRGIIWRFS